MSEEKPKQSYGFQPGNTLWRQGIEAKMEKQQRIDELMIFMASGGSHRYMELLLQLGDGQKLTREHLEFMEKVEKFLPFLKPKLSSSALSFAPDLNVPPEKREKVQNLLKALMDADKR